MYTGAVVQVIGPFAKEFAADLVNVIVTYWGNAISPAVHRQCIRLTYITANVLQTDFRPHISRLAPCFLRSLKQDTVEENLVSVSSTRPHSSTFAFLKPLGYLFEILTPWES